jgi:hypothetical protein
MIPMSIAEWYVLLLLLVYVSVNNLRLQRPAVRWKRGVQRDRWLHNRWTEDPDLLARRGGKRKRIPASSEKVQKRKKQSLIPLFDTNQMGPQPPPPNDGVWRAPHQRSADGQQSQEIVVVVTARDEEGSSFA